MSVFTRSKESTTRADQLRRKRGQNGRSLNWEAGAAVPRPMWEPRIQRRPAPRAYRRVNIPLDDRGVEVQFPTLSLAVSPRTFATVLAVLAGAAILFLISASTFRAGAPVVNGVAIVPADDVLKAAGIDGANLFLLSPAEIGDRIVQRIPGIRQVSVLVDLTGRVSINVVERVPILLWEQDGLDYWVDSQGVVYPATETLAGLVKVEVPGQGPQLAPDGQAYLDPSLVVNALEMAVALPSGSRILYDTAHGLGMSDPGGWTVYFGTSGNIELKMETYQRLLQKLNAAGIRPAVVDVSDLWQPYYRLPQSAPEGGLESANGQ
jgi:cell division septal protein FtsQ